MQAVINMNFDAKGNLEPYEVFPLEIEIFHSFFVKEFDKSTSRAKIFENYTKYISDLTSALKLESFYQLINGSYTTNKQDPQDIDLVNFIKASDCNKAIESGKGEEIKKFLTQGKSKENYMVDGYLVPVYDENDPKYSTITLSRVNYWTKWFGKDREGQAKGIIKINFEEKVIEMMKGLQNEK